MDEALSHGTDAKGRGAPKDYSALDWRKKASDHVAFGLLVYTAMHIFWTLTQLKTAVGTILPYFALVFLVGAIIPACRWMESRWAALSDEQATDPALRPQFRREMAFVWLAAIGLPIVLTFAFKGLAALF